MSLFKKIHDDQVWSKVAAGLLLLVIGSFLAYLAYCFFPDGWASVVDAGHSAWDRLVTGLKDQIEAPLWVLLLIGFGIVAVFAGIFWRMAHVSERYQQECIDLRKQVKDLRQEIDQSQPVELSPVQEIQLKGICWCRTPGGQSDPVEATCPTCGLRLHPSRRFSLNGSPVCYFCERCNKEIAKFDVSHRVLVDQVLGEIERLERKEQKRLTDLIAEKIADGLPAEEARAGALRQIEHDRASAGPQTVDIRCARP